MDLKYLENQNLRRDIKENTLSLYKNLSVNTLYDYIIKRFDTEEIAFDKINHLGFIRNLCHFQNAAINIDKLKFSDGIWHFFKIKQNDKSDLYFSDPLVKTDSILIFFYEEKTNYWGCNGQLLYKELNALPCNPYRTLTGWNEEEEWNMYIDHKILVL